jgi:hypothetical protein
LLDYKAAVLDALRREGSLATETSIYPYYRARDCPSRATTTCGFLISTRDIINIKNLTENKLEHETKILEFEIKKKFNNSYEK